MFLGEKRGDEEAVEQSVYRRGLYVRYKYHKLLYNFFFPHNKWAGGSPRDYPGFTSTVLEQLSITVRQQTVI